MSDIRCIGIGTGGGDVPESHHRVMVVEVMGRDAGWIALHAGIAGGAHVILIPEIPFTVQNICDYVTRREGYGKRFTIVVVAEGVKLPSEMKHMARGLPVGNMLGDAIALLSHKEVRVSVLGHIQRADHPRPTIVFWPRASVWRRWTWSPRADSARQFA